MIVIIGLSNVFGLQYLMPSGNEKKFIIALLFGAFTNIILNLILIPIYWSLGAAIGTIVAELVVTVTMGIFVRKEVNILKCILLSWKTILSAVSMFVAIYFIKGLFNENIVNCFILILIGIFVYFSLLLVLREKMILDFIKKSIRRLKRKKNNR